MSVLRSNLRGKRRSLQNTNEVNFAFAFPEDSYTLFLVTLLLLYAGYGVLFMTAFNGIIVILPAMEGDDSITFENSTAGRLLAIGNIAYLV